MDLKMIATTFTVIFIAELADKTQVATFAFATKGNSRLSVFIGAASALVLSSLIAVVLGNALGVHLPERYLRPFAGVLFVIVGLVYLIKG